MSTTSKTTTTGTVIKRASTEMGFALGRQSIPIGFRSSEKYNVVSLKKGKTTRRRRARILLRDETPASDESNR
jgi:hypothetical protein